MANSSKIDTKALEQLKEFASLDKSDLGVYLEAEGHVHQATQMLINIAGTNDMQAKMFIDQLAGAVHFLLHGNENSKFEGKYERLARFETDVTTAEENQKRGRAMGQHRLEKAQAIRDAEEYALRDLLLIHRVFCQEYKRVTGEAWEPRNGGKKSPTTNTPSLKDRMAS